MKDAQGHGSNARGNSTDGFRAGYEGRSGNPHPFGSPERLDWEKQWSAGLAQYEKDNPTPNPATAVAASHGIETSHLSGPVDGNYGTRYNREAVNNAIASSNRAGRRIGGKEASMIHRLLKGRQVGDS